MLVWIRVMVTSMIVLLVTSWYCSLVELEFNEQCAPALPVVICSSPHLLAHRTTHVHAVMSSSKKS